MDPGIILKECFAIAEYLYRAGTIRNAQSEIRNPYADIYAWIKTQVKRRKDLTLVLQALAQLRTYHDAGKKVVEFWPYMEGTMRRLETEKEGKTIRRGGPASFEQILGRAYEKLKEEKKDGTKV